MSGEESATGRGQARIRVLPGVRAAEAALLEGVSAACPPRPDPRALAAPLRVVVPSDGLRRHLAAKLVAQAGGARVGVRIQTLSGAAIEALDRAGETPPRGESAFAILVRREARGEPELREPLDSLRDGYGPVVGAVSDLLDAGFTPAHEPGVLEALAGAASGALLRRAQAVVRVAGRVAQALSRFGVGHRSVLLRRAREILLREGGRILPTRALWIYGFADATGVAADWLEALLERLGGTLVVSEPPSPFAPEAREGAFVRVFLERLATVASPEREAERLEPPRVERLEAAGLTAEARAVAERVRLLLDAGAVPERIAIVARSLAPYATRLRAELARLGVPHSAPGTNAPPDAVVRRAHGLLALLEEGEDVALERALALVEPRRLRDPAAQREAAHVLGLRRLRELARLDLGTRLPDGRGVRLRRPTGSEPVGKVPSDGAGASADVAEARDEVGSKSAAAAESVRHGRERGVRPGGGRPRHAWLGRSELEAARAWAMELARALEAWPAPAPASQQLAWLRRLVEDSLGWRREDRLAAPVLETLERLASELPDRLDLDRKELVELLASGFERWVRRPLAGRGGGVALLSVMEARGRSFDHLFVIGLERDLFPRTIVEDPLLPDRVRARLRATVLPDFPVKRRGHDEERHLFAELLSAAPNLVLSRPALDDEGRGRAPSPFWVRLELEGRGGAAVVRVAARAELDAAAPRPSYPASAHALGAALAAPRGVLEGRFALAFEEVLDELGFDRERAREDARALAAHRVALLEELDPGSFLADGRSRPLSLGPFHGFVGAVRPERVPSEAPEIHVTGLEELAACPWRSFLARALGLEPPADALEALPRLERRWLGSLVHRVLERLVSGRAGVSRGSLAEALARAGWSPSEPAPSELERAIESALSELAREEGGPLAVVAPGLRELARQRIEIACEHWRAEPELRVLGGEVEGSLVLRDARGRERRIGFRADRVDRLEKGVRLIDYKTGGIKIRDKKEETRLKHLLEKVASGELLQAAAYLRAGLEHCPHGRLEAAYLWLDPNAEPAQRVLALSAARREALEAFDRCCRVLFALLDAGAFPPRLFEKTVGDEKEAEACRSCDLVDACLQGETAQRRRLALWLERHPPLAEGSDPLGRAERAWRDGFGLRLRWPALAPSKGREASVPFGEAEP